MTRRVVVTAFGKSAGTGNLWKKEPPRWVH
jgi:hypothetical protein